MSARNFSIFAMRLISGILLVSVVGFTQKITLVQGKVTDAADGSPLKDVRVHVEDIKDVSDVLTNVEGKYTIAILDRAKVQLTFSLKNYNTVTREVNLSENIVQLNVELTSTKVIIKMTDFRQNAYIKGKVIGLDPKMYPMFKLVAYVLTDMWYIHPYAQNAPGKGFAIIEEDGTWRLDTVWRGYQAYKIAFLLVPKEAYVPPTVQLKGDIAESALLEKIPCDYYEIVPAPEGI